MGERGIHNSEIVLQGVSRPVSFWILIFFKSVLTFVLAGRCVPPRAPACDVGGGASAMLLLIALGVSLW